MLTGLSIAMDNGFSTPVSERLFKVIIIGDSLVGKSSFVYRYVKGKFDSGFKTTVGVDFALKKIKKSPDEIIRLQLWDIAGQERFTSLTRVYYRDAAACVIMFDITKQQTLQNVVRWKQDVDKKVHEKDGVTPIPSLLLANKIDLPGHCITDNEIKEFTKKHSFLGWNKISVKENINIEESMKFLVEELLARKEAGSRAEDFTDGDGRIRIPENMQSSKPFCCF